MVKLQNLLNAPRTSANFAKGVKYLLVCLFVCSFVCRLEYLKVMHELS